MWLSKTKKSFKGCDSGFGYEIAKLLNSKGFVVFAFCLDPTTSDLRQRCKFKDNIILYKVDVTNDDDIKQAKQSINEYVKQNNILLWGLVNNAGIAISKIIKILFKFLSLV